jgi:hypothetical protein
MAITTSNAIIVSRRPLAGGFLVWTVVRVAVHSAPHGSPEVPHTPGPERSRAGRDIIGVEELPTQRRHRLPAKNRALARNAHTHISTARRVDAREHHVGARLPLPVLAEHAVRRCAGAAKPSVSGSGRSPTLVHGVSDGRWRGGADAAGDGAVARWRGGPWRGERAAGDGAVGGGTSADGSSLTTTRVKSSPFKSSQARTSADGILVDSDTWREAARREGVLVALPPGLGGAGAAFGRHRQHAAHDLRRFGRHVLESCES